MCIHEEVVYCPTQPYIQTACVGNVNRSRRRLENRKWSPQIWDSGIRGHRAEREDADGKSARGIKCKE